MKNNTFRVVRVIITEIVFMALGVVCIVMPMPWRLIVPIIIGVRSILLKAYLSLRKPLPLNAEGSSPGVKVRGKKSKSVRAVSNQSKRAGHTKKQGKKSIVK